MRTYFVYILASATRRLYIGVTNDLLRRVWQHRFAPGTSFTHRYGITRLVHYEVFGDIRTAIAREKQLKALHRPRKIRLIERHNRDWLDVAAFWFN